MLHQRNHNYRLKMFYETYTARMTPKGLKNAFFVPGGLDLQTHPSKEQGTKHVFRVNLAQIRSAVPEMSNYTNKKPQTDGAKNRTFCSSLHVAV